MEPNPKPGKPKWTRNRVPNQYLGGPGAIRALLDFGLDPANPPQHRIQALLRLVSYYHGEPAQAEAPAAPVQKGAAVALPSVVPPVLAGLKRVGSDDERRRLAEPLRDARESVGR